MKDEDQVVFELLVNVPNNWVFLERVYTLVSIIILCHLNGRYK